MTTQEQAYQSNTFDSNLYGLTKGFLEWWDDASCRTTEEGKAVNWFSNSALQVQNAKMICAVCPVREDCLQYAIDNDLRFWVLGGLDEDERKALR